MTCALFALSGQGHTDVVMDDNTDRSRVRPQSSRSRSAARVIARDPADGRPVGFRWDYDRAEIIADGVVHAIGVCFGVIGSIALVVFAWNSAGNLELASVLPYAIGLLAMLAFSAAYNMWPVSPVKWLLRRFDHSAIFVLIAGTYTPFIALMKASIASGMLLVVIWATAAVGAVLKVVLPGRFDRFSIALYLLLGWSGVLAYESVIAVLPSFTLWFLAVGGALYTIGVIFHIWAGLRFQNAIWHGCVLAAASCHYTAVVEFLVVTAT